MQVHGYGTRCAERENIMSKRKLVWEPTLKSMVEVSPKKTATARHAEEMFRQTASKAEFVAEHGKADRKAKKLRLVAERAADQRDSNLESAAELLINSRSGHLSAEEYRRYGTLLDGAFQSEARRELADRVAKGEERVASVMARVHERSIYVKDGPNNWFADIALWAISQQHPTYPGVREATRRLEQYKVEQRSWTGADRRYLERVQIENHSGRGVDGTGQELRAPMSSAVGVGGELIAPVWVLSQVPVYRPSLCSFESQCMHLDLPDYGLSVIVPNFASMSGISVQAGENQGLQETDPTTGYLLSGAAPPYFAEKNVETVAGVVTMSQQMIDRTARTFDPLAGRIVSGQELVASQLTADLEEQRNLLTIKTVLAGISSPIDDSGSFGTASFWSDVAQAKQAIATTAGTAYKATHLFLPSPVVDKLAEQVDGDMRPIWTPDWATMSNADDADTGYEVQGLRIFRDDSIPSLDGNFQLLASRPKSVLVLTAPPVIQLIPQEFATTLSCVLRLRQYIAIVPLYPLAHEVITGDAYVTSLSA